MRQWGEDVIWVDNTGINVSWRRNKMDGTVISDGFITNYTVHVGPFRAIRVTVAHNFIRYDGLIRNLTAKIQSRRTDKTYMRQQIIEVPTHLLVTTDLDVSDINEHIFLAVNFLSYEEIGPQENRYCRVESIEFIV